MKPTTNHEPLAFTITMAVVFIPIAVVGVVLSMFKRAIRHAYFKVTRQTRHRHYHMKR